MSGEIEKDWDSAPISATHWCECLCKWIDDSIDTDKDCCIPVPRVALTEPAMPKVYHPIIDNKPCIMTNTTWMSEAEAAKYCIDKFGKERFGGFDG